MRPRPDPTLPATGEDHEARTARAVRWSVSGQLGVQVVRLGFGVVLARLLSPREFGLLALVTVLTQFLTTIGDLGFEDALVQHPAPAERHRSSVFWAALLLAAALSIATAAAAPAVARFYGVDELQSLVTTLAVLFVIQSVGVVPRAMLVRRLAFRTLFAIEAGGSVVAGVVGVALAANGFGVTSLAAQILTAAVVQSVLLYGAGGWRPALVLRASALGELLGFSTYRVATRILGYWGQHVDQLVAGKLLGAASLGLYERASTLVRFPVLHVSRAVARATFPSLALVQDDPARMRALYLQTTGAVALVASPLCMGLSAAAEPLIVGLLGPHWKDAVPIMRVLAVASLVQCIATLASSVYLAQGRSGLHFAVNVFQAGAMITGIVVGQRWGVMGVAVGAAVATVLGAVPSLYVAGRLLGVSPRRLAERVWAAMAASLVMALAVGGFERVARTAVGPLPLLAGDVVVGAATYLATLLVLGAPYRDLRDLLQRPVATRVG